MHGRGQRGGDRGEGSRHGRGAGRAEEMIVNEPVNPLIKYSKPVSSLTSVGRSRSKRRDFTTGMNPARGGRKEVRKEGSVWGGRE